MHHHNLDGYTTFYPSPTENFPIQTSNKIPYQGIPFDLKSVWGIYTLTNSMSFATVTAAIDLKSYIVCPMGDKVFILSVPK